MASKHIQGLAVEIAYLSNEALYQLAQELVANYNSRADYLDMMIRTEFQEQAIARAEREARKARVAKAIAQDLIGV
jgi:hypothetical protein